VTEAVTATVAAAVAVAAEAAVAAERTARGHGLDRSEPVSKVTSYNF